MAGGQRIFELVPNTLVKPNVRPPMTSKAVKKAYQQANGRPKISRAEQRRRDAAELERQKREYERERAAARAKAAREKKAAKVNAEKEERRKKGIPEPSKFVRASQPTISRFVKGNGTKRTWQDTAAEDSDRTISDTEHDCGELPAKRIATAKDSDDEFGEFPSLSQSDILEKINSSIPLVKYGVSVPGSPISKPVPKPVPEPRYREASRAHTAMKSNHDSLMEDYEAFDDMATTQLLSDLAEAVPKSDSVEPPDIQRCCPKEPKIPPVLPTSPWRSGRVVAKLSNTIHTHGKDTSRLVKIKEKTISTGNVMQPPKCSTVSQSNDSSKSHKAPRPILLERPVNMPPPYLPIKADKSISFAATPQRPVLPNRNTRNSGFRALGNAPPTSTQAFLENHLDEFFPSPTQEIRELLDDADDLPSNTQIARELSPVKEEEENNFDALICTQALVVSPEDLDEISTPSRALLKPAIVPADRVTSRPTSREKPRFFEEKEEDIFHAAIQESKALSFHEPKKVPLNDAALVNRYQSDSTDYGDFDFDSGDLPHLFQEKDDEDLQTAIRESKLFAEQGAKRVACVDPPSLNRDQSNSTDYGDFEQIFAEQGKEPSHVGGNDRRCMPHTWTPLASTAMANSKDAKSRRFFEEKEEDQLYAALHESRLSTAPSLPLKKAQVQDKPKRKLKRVQSTATDYGDDDFNGCSQELLALFE